MKELITILLLMTMGSLTAKSELRLIVPYTIISDSVSTQVPEGYCKVKGRVVLTDSSVVRKGFVANYDMTRKAKIAEGTFDLIIPTTDSIVFFYSPNYGEIIMSPYDFKSSHEVTVHFYPTDPQIMMEVDKPVIYCYSEQPLTATIDLNFNGDFTFSYPAYNEGWKVAVNESGSLKTDDGNSYPYLFWEGETSSLSFQENKNGAYDGFFVQTDTIISFFEDQLTALSLNRQEQTDFITYWAPRIIENEHVFIQFMVDEAYAENIAEISITPKPDHLRRVYMLFTPISESHNLDLNPQIFKPINRNGFTVIEWGGSEMNINTNQL